MISILDTSISTSNHGDEIIMDACNEYLKEIFKLEDYYTIPWHTKISWNTLNIINNSELIILSWTNALKSPILMRPFFKWLSFLFLKNKIVLLWVGWWKYQKYIDPFTKIILKYSLSKDYFHSVRDEYTKNKLEELWFNNVINTSCPTLWKIKNNFLNIPKKEKVIFTLTVYSKDIINDNLLISILQKQYKEVLFWPQQIWDLEYINKLWATKDIKILPWNLESYNELLKTWEYDYIWTRLHAWVRALQRWVRTIIIGIDNRAREISKDIWLYIVERSNLDKLNELIPAIIDKKIITNQNNINKWKVQFNKK